MEVITIEKNTFEEFKMEFDAVVNQAREITQRFRPPRSQWLDNHDVCAMLIIDKRTLQNYKDRGLLPFSRINRKNYFKISDVERLIQNRSK